MTLLSACVCVCVVKISQKVKSQNESLITAKNLLTGMLLEITVLGGVESIHEFTDKPEMKFVISCK